METKADSMQLIYKKTESQHQTSCEPRNENK